MSNTSSSHIATAAIVIFTGLCASFVFHTLSGALQYPSIV